MSRAWSVYAAVGLILVALAFFAWISRQPDAGFFDQAERWALIGPQIARLRHLYRDRALGDRDARVAALDERKASRGARARDALGREGQPETIWIGLGASLRERPDVDSLLLELTRSLASYAVLGRRGRWLQVARYEGAAAWYDPLAPRDLTPPLGMATEPVLPVAAVAAEDTRLDLARQILGPGASTHRLHDYGLLTDIDPSSVLGTAVFDAFERRLERVEQVYLTIYGVAPIGLPAETVVLFRSEEDYRRFEREIADLSGETTGHASRGTVALFVGDRSIEEAAATLIHEVGHLLNRRALGPALPMWLDEGIAEDLAHFALGEVLDPERGPYAGQRIELDERQILYTGNLGSLVALRRVAQRGELPPLEILSAEDLSDARGSSSVPLFYSQVGFWIRSLRSSRAPHLRSFLQSVSTGGPPNGEALRESLGAEWADLDFEFRTFLDRQAAMAQLPELDSAGGESKAAPPSESSGSSSRQATPPSR